MKVPEREVHSLLPIEDSFQCCLSCLPWMLPAEEHTSPATASQYPNIWAFYSRALLHFTSRPLKLIPFNTCLLSVSQESKASPHRAGRQGTRRAGQPFT